MQKIADHSCAPNEISSHYLTNRSGRVRAAKEVILTLPRSPSAGGYWILDPVSEQKLSRMKEFLKTDLTLTIPV